MMFLYRAHHFMEPRSFLDKVENFEFHSTSLCSSSICKRRTSCSALFIISVSFRVKNIGNIGGFVPFKYLHFQQKEGDNSVVGCLKFNY